MRYTTKVRLRKAIYISIVILVFIALNYFLITKVFNKTTPIEKSAVLIATGNTSQIFPYEDGSIAIIGDQINCYDSKGNLLYTATLPSEGMKAYRNDKLTICWDTNLYPNLVVILDEFGEDKFQEQLDGEEILMATCNSSQFAVAILEEDQTWLRVYNLEGVLIEENVQPFLSVLSIGYFGEKDIQLWDLMLDYHGTLPITRLYTSHP